MEKQKMLKKNLFLRKYERIKVNQINRKNKQSIPGSFADVRLELFCDILEGTGGGGGIEGSSVGDLGPFADEDWLLPLVD
jgi:hypothetical protein